MAGSAPFPYLPGSMSQLITLVSSRWHTSWVVSEDVQVVVIPPRHGHDTASVIVTPGPPAYTA